MNTLTKLNRYYGLCINLIKINPLLMSKTKKKFYHTSLLKRIFNDGYIFIFLKLLIKFYSLQFNTDFKSLSGLNILLLLLLL
jgi:hypothetical protein